MLIWLLASICVTTTLAFNLRDVCTSLRTYEYVCGFAGKGVYRSAMVATHVEVIKFQRLENSVLSTTNIPNLQRVVIHYRDETGTLSPCQHLIGSTNHWIGIEIEGKLTRCVSLLSLCVSVRSVLCVPKFDHPL